MPKRPYSLRGYQRERATLLGQPCAHGCGRPSSTADHQPPLALHHHVEGSGCCVLVPSCAKCAVEQGGRISRMLYAGAAKIEIEVVEPDGFGPADPVWDRAPWLKSLRRVPRDACWPRLMTGPHPKATGTFGPQFVRWAQAWTGVRLRWFQKLIAYRMLEHDRRKQLVWEQVIVTMARQVGKSYLLRLLALWRMLHGDLFGGPQLVLHTASTEKIAREVIGPVLTWADRSKELYKTRHTNGEYEVLQRATGSKWIVRSTRSLVGYSAGLAICDEGFDVDEDVVTQALEPTTAAIDNSQLLLVSTANSHPKDLIPNRRMSALSTLADPGVDLLLEWSAPRTMDIWDRQAWRQASPHWTDRRERLIERKLRDAEAKGEGLDAVAAQWFCWWPPKATPKAKGEPLVAGADWDGLESDVDADGPLVLVVEDWFGRGACGLAAGVTGGDQFTVGGWEFPSRVEAFDWVRYWARQRPGSTLIVGAGMKGDPAIDTVEAAEVRYAGSSEARAGLPLLRELVTAGRVVHDGSADLCAQMRTARVNPSSAGLMLLPSPRSDLTRALVWALHVLEHDRPAVPAIW